MDNVPRQLDAVLRATAAGQVDREGGYDSKWFTEQCHSHGIEVDMAAGEAHWRQGVVERIIGELKSVVGKVALEQPGASAGAVLRRAVQAHNNLRLL